ncbi:MAG: efflux RND transporter periplasmic adaptor subunit [Bacteroidota bacterium]
MTIRGLLKSRILIIGISLIALIAASYLLFGSTSNRASQYTFVTITKGDLESTISSTGTLSPVTQVEVGTQVSGRIDKVLIDFNDKVKKGQVIAVLDTSLLRSAVTDAQSGFLRSEAQLEEAQTNYRRSSELLKKGMLSESEFQTVKTTLKTAQASLISAQAALDRAQQNLKYAIIRSPIDGTVTARNVEAGQTVAASFSTPTLFTIAQDLSKMEIKALVDESDIGQIKEGQSVRFTVQAYPEKKFEGKAKQVRVQPMTVSNVVNYTVVISAENRDNLLLPGMTATVDFVIEHKTDALMVSNAALRFQPTEKELAEAQKAMRFLRPPAPPDSLKISMQPPAAPSGTTSEWKVLWYYDNDSKLVAAPVQVGITDGTNTEILGNHFSVGMKVISGSESATNIRTPSRSPNSGPPPMM